MGRGLTLAALGTATIVASACSGWRPEEPAIDGWPLGTVSTCEPVVVGDAEYDVVEIALAELGGADPRVTTTTCYAEGAYLNGSTSTIVNRSGSVVVVVFSLAGGSDRAIGVHCATGCSYVRPPVGPSG